jgi:CelD/BcsL family acetyltransferase involved in cellulose biosynthesis
LLRRGWTRTVFQTREWQRAWWESFGRGELLLVVASRGEPIALAPFFADEDGMVYFVASGGSDYLDFVGDASDPEVLAALLAAAADLAPDFAGFRFYHLPGRSPTARVLQTAATLLGFTWVDEGSLVAPALESSQFPAVAEKKGLLYYENYLRRRGSLEVLHARDGAAILPQLDAFFAQHVARWSITEHPSLFLQPRERAFYRKVIHRAADTGWLRFTRVAWDERPIAFHLGFSYHGRYLMYKPTFDIELARRSPGQVLLRQLLLDAVAEGAAVFDFGLGDEPYKRRFATRIDAVRTIGVYPRQIS